MSWAKGSKGRTRNTNLKRNFPATASPWEKTERDNPGKVGEYCG